MAKYEGRPGDYKPELEIQLRRSPEGGGLRKPGSAKALGPALGRREMTVMLHGFNNHEGEAALAYQGFRLAQYSRSGGPLPGSLDKVLGDGFWPGDGALWRWIDWADALVYPKAVGTAPKAAAVLADLIVDKFPNLERVNFIAHSLGCRVALETVSRLLQRGRPAVGRLCLMAAAVPCEMVEADGRFAADLRRLQAQGVRIHILHSDADTVLKWTFVPGQAAAGPKEASMRALGLKGPPRDMPGLGENVTEGRISGAGHSDYWGHFTTGASLSATEAAAAFFGFGSPRRKIGTRTLR